jgi:hypothetical protein
MNNYAAWEEQSANVTALLLDPHNPRIPELGHQASQREIAAELVANDAVYDLAKDIVAQGFYPTEVLICVEESHALTVVEGNRRLAALKLLVSPEMAPSPWVARFRALSRKVSGAAIQEVKVVIAPSRSEAVPLIMNRHTQTGIKRWETIQQARYVHSLRASGMTLEQLADMTGFTKGELLSRIRTHTMYEIANTLGLDARRSETVRDPRKFNISTLERVTGSVRMREFLGISFDNEGKIVGAVHPEDFKKAYKKIVNDIVDGTIDTRKLNNDNAMQHYIKDKLQSVSPKRAGSFNSTTLLEGVAAGNASSAPAAGSKLKQRQERKPPYLIPKSLKCHLPMPRISEVLSELQKLKVDGFENAVAVLLRIFIEMSISHYMESTGSMKVLVARQNAKTKAGTKPDTWTPSFRQMLGDILENDSAVISAIPKQALKALKKAVSDDSYPLSLDGMDQFVHNPYVAPTERQLRQFWNSFQGLMEYLMEDHTPAPAARAGK